VSLLVIHLAKLTRGSHIVPLMPSPSWDGYQISMLTRPYHIFGSAETLMADLAAVSVQRATPDKVRVLSLILGILLIAERQVFVCVAALAILDKLNEVDEQTLGWWLAERQLPNGGLNGRPEKLEDVRIQ
jgi:hypothetical protein